MSKILDVTRRHASVLPVPKHGVDTFSLAMPAGQIFHGCRLTLFEARPGAGARILSQPGANAGGQGQVAVEWYHPGAARLRYQLEAFSSSGQAASSPVAPTAVMTGFDPLKHGFRFNNAFPPHPHIQLPTPFGRIRIGDAKNGLCGGMVFVALDYFRAGQPVPDVNKPPSGDILFDYIVKRLYDSFNLPFGIGGYIELMQPDLPDYAAGFNALSSRAWRTARQEWPILKTLLDAGQPCPLGLVRVKSTDLRKLGENHQVMAYGYDVKDDQLTLFIYDPNYQDNTNIKITLDLSDPEGPTAMNYSSGEPLYAFFHVRYRFNPPPVESAAKGRILIFEHRNFEGRAKDISLGSPNLSLSEDGFFDDQVSSFIIASGNWMFYKHSGFRSPYMRAGKPLILGPGQYSSVEALGIPEDDISSLRAVSLQVNG
jgi:hypothetical protein